MPTETAPLDVGIHTIPAAVYHADPCPEPSLSASIITRLCLASPLHAQHDHPRLNPGAVNEESEIFDIGTAAHALLLEGRSQIAIIEADDWRTKVAKEQRDTARKAGKLPLLKKKWDDVQAMASAARTQLDRHTDGGAEMFTKGQPEQTLIWREDDVWCRARLDWLRLGNIDDFKSTNGSANPEMWSRAMFGMGADVQACWYLRGAKVLTGMDLTFRFAIQETSAPYALSVLGLGPDAMVLGEKKVLFGLETWRECRAKNKWPGYPRRTCWATLPAWEEARWLSKEMGGSLW